MRQGYITCCYKCEDRHVGCHSTCEKYIEQKAMSDAERDKRNRDTAIHGDIYYGGKRHEKRGQR